MVTAVSHFNSHGAAKNEPQLLNNFQLKNMGTINKLDVKSSIIYFMGGGKRTIARFVLSVYNCANV